VRAQPELEGAWRLDVTEPGTLESLSLITDDRAKRPLAEGELRIGVRAAGLNFRDLLVALGMVPGGGQGLGSEGAGVVLEVGPGVSGFAVGDRVLGLIGDAFGPVAVADARLLVGIPTGWSFVEAASVPVNFLTAYYALVDLAELGAGDKLLVHAAAGGVGMAAVQLARHLGVEVFATASPQKWEAVRALGVEPGRVASSRTLGFKEAFLDATGGAGMDVVLDSLAGEFVDASLELLPRGGRLVEMGKTDIRDAEQVASRYPGVRYRAFDLMDAGPGRIGAMFEELLGLFERGVLKHAPITAWDVRQGASAFRHLRQARHVGKIVLTVPQPVDPERTVLVTGGTGGLGALVARHLVVEHGVTHLVLVSRRGPEAQGAAELRVELRELGCEATIVACDVAERDQLAAVLDGIPPERPLGAVVHAAGVLDDGTLETLTGEKLERVLRPKLDAAVHLHELTSGLELSQFVMFSSVSGALGSPGQGNYAAANAFLDALAQRRRAQGLPAASLAWGLWEQASGMTRGLSDADRDRMQRQGIAPLSSDRGLELFDLARARPDPLLLPLPLDRSVLRAQADAGTLPAVFRGLVRATARRAAAGSLAQRLAGVPETERDGVVLELVRSHVAAVLGHASPEAIEPDRAFKELGFDSLGAVELRNRLSQATSLRLPSTLIFDHPNTAAVTKFLRAQAEEAAPASSHIDPHERRIREALASIPISTLDAAGVLEPLMSLIDSDRSSASIDEESEIALIDSLDVAKLVAKSLERRSDD
jgi:polyketide synthase 12